MDIRTLEGTDPLGADDFTQLSAHYDGERQVLWMVINPLPRPSFTQTLLLEILELGRLVRDSGLSVKFWVIASRTPGFFSAGGDLELFVRCVRTGDREALRAYAHACIDCIDLAARGYGVGALTLALTEGTTLGGGLECALAHDFMVAGEDATFAFPEIKFNLFPGMGAYPLVARRAGAKLAEEMIASGQRYDADRLHKAGLVDSVFPTGTGFAAATEFIDTIKPRWNGISAMVRTRRLVFPVTREALIANTEDWVDSAFTIGDDALAYVEGLVRIQTEKMEKLLSVQRERAATTVGSTS